MHATGRVLTGRVLLRVTNKHAGRRRRRRRRRYAQATTRSKTTQHSIHDIPPIQIKMHLDWLQTTWTMHLNHTFVNTML